MMYACQQLVNDAGCYWQLTLAEVAAWGAEAAWGAVLAEAGLAGLAAACFRTYITSVGDNE